MTFSNQSYGGQIWSVQEMLCSVLPPLVLPTPTKVIAERVAALLAADSVKVAKILMKIAPDHANATHDGAGFRAYGKEAVRWQWHSTPQRVVPSTEVRPLPGLAPALEAPRRGLSPETYAQLRTEEAQNSRFGQCVICEEPAGPDGLCQAHHKAGIDRAEAARTGEDV